MNGEIKDWFGDRCESTTDCAGVPHVGDRSSLNRHSADPHLKPSLSPPHSRGSLLSSINTQFISTIVHPPSYINELSYRHFKNSRKYNCSRYQAKYNKLHSVSVDPRAHSLPIDVPT